MPPRNQKITLSDLRVGIFMLVALLIAGFLILNSTGSFNPFEKRIKLKTRFLSADGLHSGADVQLAGVSVGKVDEVKFLPPEEANEKERIEATLSVAAELDNKSISDLIRTDSRVQLISTSILGNDKMINIIPGTSKGTPIEDGATLVSSSPIGLNQLTATGNDLLEQINTLSIPVNEILTKANRGEGTLGRVINDEKLYDNLDGAVAETKLTMMKLQNTIERINRGDGSAGKLINDPQLYNSLNRTVKELEAISTDIRAGRGTAGKLVTDEALYNDTRVAINELRNATSKISEIADDVRSITTDIRDGRGSAGKLLRDDAFYNDTKEAIAKFGNATQRIESILADAQAGRGTIGRLITDETLYNSINQTANNVATFTGEGTKLLDDFRKNPRKYLSIKLSLF
jgi:phospholipid/cholesterol/gamma-HCH transport system substrate-binding protein